MKLDKVKLTLTKYRMKSFRLRIKTGTKKYKKHEVPSSLITSMMIAEEYDRYYYPYFYVEFSVPNSIHRLMMKHSTGILVDLQLQKAKVKQGVNLDTENNPTFKNALKETFVVVFEKNSPDLTEKSQASVEKDENKYGQLTTIGVLLYNTKYFNKCDKVVNAVLDNASLVDALAYTFNQGKVKNILLSPPANYKHRKQFVLTPISVKEQAERIANEEHLHEKGSIVFFGTDRGYVIDKTPKCTAYTKNEYKTTYIAASSVTRAVKDTGGCYTNTKKKYNVLNAVTMDFQNRSSVTKKTAGSNVVIVSDSGKITKTNKKSSNVNKVVVGSRNATSIKRAMNEAKHIATIGFRDVDIGMLTPNKQFVLALEGATLKKYNGKYRLSQVFHYFEKEGEYFQLESQAIFKGSSLKSKKKK